MIQDKEDVLQFAHKYNCTYVRAARMSLMYRYIVGFHKA
jgi:hypothetical protein